MDKQIENLIRRLGLLKMQGELDGKLHDWEIEKIIEALQAMEDLETTARGPEGVSLNSLTASRWCVMAGGCYFTDTIPEALRAAAEAIQKGENH